MQAAGLAPLLPRIEAAPAAAGPQWPILEGPTRPRSACRAGGTKPRCGASSSSGSIT